MWRRNLNTLNILLAAGIVLLLIGISTTWWGADQETRISRAAKGPQVPTAPILRDQQALPAFEVVANKDLFSPDRLGPTQAQPKTKDVLEGYSLLGIMIIGDTRAAIIGGKAAPGAKKEAAIDVVYLGEEWNGLKIAEISNESVVFQGKAGQKTLTFPE